jgi:tRNA-uridine 2-sulfurtransferase
MPTRKKVLVAMSGGVDSSVAAALLARAGFEVVGCFMRLGSPGETLDELMPFDHAEEDANRAACKTSPTNGTQPAGRTIKIGHQGCCSINDAADARLVAGELGIPFYVCNFKKQFGRIIDYFVDEYAQGRTPNPCVRCNDWLKFGQLHEYARQIGADFVASGHYARIGGLQSETSPQPSPQPDTWTEHDWTPAPGRDHPVLLRGVDQSKDQSYVLFGAPRDRLREMILPIGGMEKPRVREIAHELGLPVFDKPDSQEICFVPDQDYAGLVERRRPELAKAGNIVDESGKVVGTHQGQHRFTIGQRRGLDVALGHRIFVVGKDAQTNTVRVGEKNQLASMSCAAAEANWLIDPASIAAAPRRVLAKYRYNSAPVPASVTLLPDAPSERLSPSGRVGRFHVAFDQPQSAVAPGQALVLFDIDRPEWVLGGGWIESAALTPQQG